MAWTYEQPVSAFDTEQPPDPPTDLDASPNKARRKTKKRCMPGGRVPPIRAQKSEAELRRQSIRQTAARMIADKGILRVTMRDFTRAMHLTGESLCHYYSKREELLADIMASHLDTLMRRVCDAYDRTAADKAEQRLEAMIDAFLLSALEDRYEHRLMLRSGDVLDEKGQVSVCGRYRSLAELFAEVLAVSVPNAAPGAAKVAAMSVLATMSCAALWFRDDGAVGVAAYARMLTETAVAMAKPGLHAI
jgi:AcrR family transcriptional regulator